MRVEAGYARMNGPVSMSCRTGLLRGGRAFARLFTASHGLPLVEMNYPVIRLQSWQIAVVDFSAAFKGEQANEEDTHHTRRL